MYDTWERNVRSSGAPRRMSPIVGDVVGVAVAAVGTGIMSTLMVSGNPLLDGAYSTLCATGFLWPALRTRARVNRVEALAAMRWRSPGYSEGFTDGVRHAVRTARHTGDS